MVAFAAVMALAWFFSLTVAVLSYVVFAIGLLIVVLRR